jgi:hypothetical protein
MEALGALLIVIGMIVILMVWTGTTPQVIKAVFG